MNALMKLLITQFLSAFADNAILMATIQVILDDRLPQSYIGLVQGSFFIAYALLAPFAGGLSEKIPKSNVLWLGNSIKIVGAIFLLMHTNPVLAYGIVGIGACIYGPGKYAILREITKTQDELYKANGYVEGSTIIAILLGTVVGSFLATQSIALTMTVIMVVYIVSLLFALWLPKGDVSNVMLRFVFRDFFRDIMTLGKLKKARVSIVGTSMFWMTSSVLRLGMVAWIPLALGIGQDQASLYVGVSAIGIMFGALFSSKFIPLTQLTRLLYVGVGMALSVSAVGFLPFSIAIVLLLFIGGFCGGMFMIPLNTIVQEEGIVIGSGKTIAIQNFFENVLMFGGSMLFAGALHIGIGIPFVLLIVGGIFGMTAFFVSVQYKVHMG